MLRGTALGGKASLFCGSDRGGDRAAAIYTLIGTAKLNDVDPQAWLAAQLLMVPQNGVIANAMTVEMMDGSLRAPWSETARYTPGVPSVFDRENHMRFPAGLIHIENDRIIDDQAGCHLAYAASQRGSSVKWLLLHRSERRLPVEACHLLTQDNANLAYRPTKKSLVQGDLR